MSRKKARPEHWDYPSLEWIHRVRAQIYEEERGRPLAELSLKPSPKVRAMIRRLRLKTIRGDELPIRRRRSG